MAKKKHARLVAQARFKTAPGCQGRCFQNIETIRSEAADFKFAQARCLNGLNDILAAWRLENVWGSGCQKQRLAPTHRAGGLLNG